MMWSNPVYAYLLTGLSGLGIITNLKSYAYVTKTFDTTNNLFNILSKDSLVTAICSAIFFVTNIIKLINEDLLRSKLGCVVHFAGLFLPSMLGPLSFLLISMRRFVQLKYPNAIAHNSQKCNLIANVILAIGALYYLSYLLVDTYNDLKGFNFIEHCQGNVLEDPTKSPILIIFGIFPFILTMGSTIGFDILTYQAALQNNFLDANAGVVITAEDKQRREKIPKRATLINTCLFVPWFVFMAVLGNSFGFDLETKVLILALPNALIIALRNPLIARLAFHVNRQIMRQTVEDRRKYVIEEALEKRREQQMKKDEESNNPTQGIITPNQFVKINHLPRQCSLPNIQV